MQIWIYFSSGTGGDGLANLLEKSNKVDIIDDYEPPWRIHHFVDGQPKFWAPAPDRLYCFRNNMPFCLTNNQFTHRYLDLVNQNKNIIITSHDLNLLYLSQSDCQDILTKNKFSVFVKPTDVSNSIALGCKKNLRQIPVNLTTSSKIDESNFDLVVNYEEIISSYENFTSFTKKINLDINQEFFQQFIKIKNGDTSSATKGTPLYRSDTYFDGNIKYTQYDTL